MKKVLITGVSKGIGNACAGLLAKEGWEIVGTYNSSKKEALVLKKEVKGVTLHKVDLSKRAQTIKLLEKLKDEKFDAIINNAGVIFFEEWEKFTMKAWDETMEVNLNAPVLIAQTLRNNINRGGCIINISSTDGAVGSVSSIAYAASKAALTNLSESLTNVFGDSKIRVISISPGWIGDGMGSPVLDEAKWLNPLGRTAEYKEIAGAISLLLDEKASFINGVDIVVDGGSSAVDYCLKKEGEVS